MFCSFVFGQILRSDPIETEEAVLRLPPFPVTSRSNPSSKWVQLPIYCFIVSLTVFWEFDVEYEFSANVLNWNKIVGVKLLYVYCMTMYDFYNSHECVVLLFSGPQCSSIRKIENKLLNIGVFGLHFSGKNNAKWCTIQFFEVFFFFFG